MQAATREACCTFMPCILAQRKAVEHANVGVDPLRRVRGERIVDREQAALGLRGEGCDNGLQFGD